MAHTCRYLLQVLMNIVALRSLAMIDAATDAAEHKPDLTDLLL